MNAEQFNALIKTVKIGKLVGNARYLHISAFSEITPELKDFIVLIANALKIPQDDWNIIKLHTQQYRLSYLNYPHFYQDSYPALQQSIAAGFRIHACEGYDPESKGKVEAGVKN